MLHDIPVLGDVCQKFLIAVMIIMAIMFLLCLLRLILGPSVADRLLAVNMLGGIVIASIAILALILEETYLLDIGLIYALMSFLAVVVLSQIYVGVYRERNARKKQEKEECSDERA